MIDPEKTNPSKRTRSPAYPAIGLREAVTRASQIWDKAKRHPVSLVTACSYWGYEGIGSQGNSVVSALLKFGLVEVEGGGDAREIKLTDPAIRLVYNPDISSKQYKDDARSAALSPEIHGELWGKFGPLLPDDAIIERYLVVDRGFNDQYVKGFIRRFRESIDFANLVGNSEDTTDEHGDMPVLKNPPPPMPAPNPIHSTQVVQRADSAVAQAPPSPADSRREFTLPTPAGDISIRGPFPMSEGDWKTFMGVLGLFKGWLVTPSQALPHPAVITKSLEDVLKGDGDDDLSEIPL